MGFTVADDAIKSLTEGQKDCLRLVNEHLTSKEIARKLGISPFTVDQRLDAAKSKLGATTRKEAARMFADAEKETLYQRLVYQNGSFAEDADAASKEAPSNRAAQVSKAFSQLISVPPIGGAEHDLSKKDIIRQSIGIAFLGSVAVIIITVFLIGVMRLFN